jgi:lipoprotein-anchoring transpeptidase ErfK/SrfK
MTPNQIAAFKALEQAQQALKRGEKHLARQFAEQAARLAPELEEVWLMMAALGTPHGSVAFLERALQINPQSERAHKGMAWAMERVRKAAESPHKQPALEKTAPTAAKIPLTAPIAAEPSATQPVKIRRQAEEKATVTAPVAIFPPKPASTDAKKTNFAARYSVLVAIVLVFCLVALLAVWQGITPAAAFLFLNKQNSPAWAQVDLPKPTDATTSAATQAVTPAFPSATDLPAVPTLLPTLTGVPTETPETSATPTFTATPADTATETATSAPADTSTPVSPLADNASPTPLPTDTAAPAPTQYVPVPPSDISGGTRWIDVDLTHQMVYAYEGQTVVNSFIVSTGTWQYPTVTGQYRIYIKYRYKDMSGPGYYLPNVPYTMFFYQGYAIHGTYWHNNFGTPMSHGCVNLSIPDSEWVYNFSSVGTLVNVHY